MICLADKWLCRLPYIVANAASFPYKKNQEQQGGATDEAEPFMGCGRFGNSAVRFVF